jgi:signal transduction histidine kinase
VVGAAPVPYVDDVPLSPASPVVPVSGPSPSRRRPVVFDILTAPVSPRTWVAQIHVVADFWVGLAMFIYVVLAFSLLAAVACTVVLIPVVVWLALIGTRVIGILERYRLWLGLRVWIPDPYPHFAGSFWDRVRQRFLCDAAWKELGYAVVLFPLATVGFTATLTVWSVGLALTTLPLTITLMPDRIARTPWFDVHPGPGLASATLAGVAALFIAPWVSRGWAALDVFVARNLLGRGVTADLEDRVDVLETSRSWAFEVAEAERRRIERDLHDGAQQRLVALALELGMAREKLDSEPERARELIDKAHGDAKAAIAELRDLARGIHPPDLGETGLPGAIPVLAGRCRLPVGVEVSVPRRPAPSIEGIAYFVVSESLTNITKHARATRAGVRVTQQTGWLVVEVADDGVGGAGADGSGSGLRGLADRVAAVDGRFTVSSPVGGPTIIRAELPCAS